MPGLFSSRAGEKLSYATGGRLTLDYGSHAENDLIVRDIRLPGDDDRKGKQWMCTLCGLTKFAWRRPQCPNGCGLMDRIRR